MTKKIILGVGLILIAALFYFQPSLFSFWQNESGPRLRVVFFDVGQGDAALIITPLGKTILVDGGPDSKVLSKLGYYLPFGQKKIDIMILTHPHADHLDGLVWTLGRYQVGEIYYSGVVHTTDTFLRWLEIIKEKRIPMKIVNKQEEVDWGGGVKARFLYPNVSLRATPAQSGGSEAISPANTEEKYQNNSGLNNTSIVFKLIYGQTNFLFTGDAETPVEKILLQCDAAVCPLLEKEGVRQLAEGWLRADVLKVAHHGSHSSTSDGFLRAVQPKTAVISAGRDNDYGHPHSRTLRRLERQGVEIHRTDQEGDIEMVSDGERVERKK